MVNRITASSSICTLRIVLLPEDTMRSFHCAWLFMSPWLVGEDFADICYRCLGFCGYHDGVMVRCTLRLECLKRLQIQGSRAPIAQGTNYAVAPVTRVFGQDLVAVESVENIFRKPIERRYGLLPRLSSYILHSAHSGQSILPAPPNELADIIGVALALHGKA